MNRCPACHQKGKPVPGQTVKSLISVSLRNVRADAYLFCSTQTCPVVYFTHSGEQSFTIDQVRELVYQKQPHNDEVLVCYCFRHRLGAIRAASPTVQSAILDDINAGIAAGQCACDLHNPQGTCCLGNVRNLISDSAKSVPPTSSNC